MIPRFVSYLPVWLWVSVVCALQANAQTLIVLENPSFEERQPAQSHPPRGWFYCGPRGETPPDTHPNDFFPQKLVATNGHTYAGMVVRDNQTWEALGQVLSSPLQAGISYTFSIDLATPEAFFSLSRTSMEEANFNNPIRLRLWGADRLCEKQELLAESPSVRNKTWQPYSFILQPVLDAKVLILEAYYDKEYSDRPYNACLLMDNASPIFPVNTKTGDTLTPIPVVVIPEISHINDLKNLVSTFASGIKLGKSGNFMDQTLFKDANGHVWHTNQALWMMISVLAQYPGAEITIWSGKRGKLPVSYFEEIISPIAQKVKLPSRSSFRIVSGTPHKNQQDLCWSDPEKKLYIRVKVE